MILAALNDRAQEEPIMDPHRSMLDIDNKCNEYMSRKRCSQEPTVNYTVRLPSNDVFRCQLIVTLQGTSAQERLRRKTKKHPIIVGLLRH